MTQENLIIIGSGPAGLTAALYAARANLNPLLITGNELGGQIAITNEVENYPGFDSILGPELTEKMKEQAEKFGARFEYSSVTEVDLAKGSPFFLKTYNGEYQAKAMIVAAGASAKRLGIPGEEEFIGRGVSYCATCDGFFFKGKDVLVVGGGDSALQEGLFLTKYATQVRIVHRRNSLRAGEFLKARATENEKINFVWNTVLEEIRGNGAVQEVVAKNLTTGQMERLKTDGVFVFVGHFPNTQIFEGQLAMENGYIVTRGGREGNATATSVPGVFAAGDVQDHVYRQAVTSAGTGCMAALDAEKFLDEIG
ncbi:MAG TPA: thioredoxin-disulfide reductase [Anaerolineales bacterium]|nr:thioredoxin-disulfide reductase [Anaerolineales bacterium]